MSKFSDPKIGVALGGGAARGLSHIAYMEAMDELGIKPVRISGTSIGSLMGSGWAAGMSGKEIREFAIENLGSKRNILGRMWKPNFADVRTFLGGGLSLQLDAQDVIRNFMPAQVPADFSELKIPFQVITTDVHSWHQVVLHTGEIIPAVASSIAIPSVFKPVEYAGRVLIDGSVVNPLSLDATMRDADFLISIDVGGDPSDKDPTIIPTGLDVGWRSAEIMMNTLAVQTLATFPPDVYERVDIKGIGQMEFWRVREIIRAGERRKDNFKKRIETALEKAIASR